MTNRKELDREFFKGKRPWSKIKDEVLGKYLKPYLAKVKMLKKEILLIDTFAGPGKFDDGESGSPLMMVQMARKMVNDNYKAIFVNNDRVHHESILHLFGEKCPLGNLIENQIVIPIYDDAKKFLIRLNSSLTDQTVFLYLDPYALEGCEFNTWLPFLKREQKASTEILVNINISAIRRLASRKSFSKGKINNEIIRHHKRLDEVIGGKYWREFLLGSSLSQKDAEEELMKKFKKRILKYVKYVGYCPVKEKPKNLAKFYIMFLSNSEDGLMLMNDIMCKAYDTRMKKSITKPIPLFPDMEIKWKNEENTMELRNIILTFITSEPNKSRKEYWLLICIDYFMQYIEREYRAAVKDLHHDNKLLFKNVKGTKRLNDHSILYLPDHKSI
ncbi:MAG: three-Cys-motif partner protein TcmP [Candidatus Marinimicrobia bacterium]|nr:three-Cys-motif partner protein TcmP [Candidatus Neomarinimicrobiota bacterium]